MNWEQVVERCCRDLRRYLEKALAETRGGVVSVKLQRLLRVELSHSDLVRYATCLNYMLSRYRWGRSYVIPRQDVAQLLESFDQLCRRVKCKTEMKNKTVKTQYRPPGEKMVLISFHLPRKMLQMLNGYAAELKTTRSAVIRRAIAQMLERVRKTTQEQAAQVVS